MSESNGVGEDVVRRIEDGVAWIVLNRPDAANAMTAAMRNQISDWLEEASADLAVRVVVITAAGDRAFCTGADLRGGRATPLPRPAGAPENAVGDGARMIRTGWQRLVNAVVDCEKPVIAGVNGTAAGGGMHLALACDIVVAAEESKFIEVFIRRGIAPDAGGAWLLTRLVGIQMPRSSSSSATTCRRPRPTASAWSTGSSPGPSSKRRWPRWPGGWPRAPPRPSASPSG